MILQNPYVVVDCPICGRPLEMKSNRVGQEVHCGHCRGGLIVNEAANGSLIARNSNGNEALRRAEQLLRITHGSGSSASHHREPLKLPQASRLNDKKRTGNFSCTSPQDELCKGDPQPTILLVEHRDEVFARLATDIAEFGIRVIRAKSATGAQKLYDTHKPTLLVGNVDLPGQSGWLMAAKLRLFDRRIRVWLYQRMPSHYGHEIAKFLRVEALLAYQGDLIRLSETIIDLMGNPHKSHDSSDDSDRTEESTAA